MGLTHLFPSADAVAGGALDGIGLTDSRARTLHQLAVAVLDGEVVLDGSVDLDELERQLTAVRGIGPWTAQYVALRLGERDAFPAGDLGIRRALEQLAPGTDLAGAAASWSPWRATAAAHLWQAGS